MEYFYSGGGNNRPDFTYRFTMKEITEGMHHWCNNYPLTGPFQRWHIVRNFGQPTDGDRAEVPLIQFESQQAAYWFRIAFSEYIVEDKTYSFAKDWLNET
jgi:hypothetical protein